MSNEFSIVPVIRVATTGRAKCQVSKEKIEAGEQRVGYTVHKQGVPGHQIMKWIKPSAFASNCITVIYGAAKAKCAYDKTTVLERGQPRLKIALKNCQGEDKEKRYFHPANEAVRTFINALLALKGCKGTTIKKIAATLDGPASHRKYVADCLNGVDVSDREVPQKAGTSATPKTTGKKRKKVEVEEEEEVVNEEVVNKEEVASDDESDNGEVVD